MSIATELTLLANSKQAIKNSINQKGGSITDSTPFADYSTAIDNLPSGGSGNPLIKSIDVSDFTGTTFNQATSYITDVTIPSGVTSIGNIAVKGLHITSLTIPDSVTSIGSASIANCYSLTSLTIGTGLRTVNYTAFEHCDNLTSVYYRGSLADWCGIDFGTYNFGSATLGQPLYNNANSRLYINNTAITGELTIPSTVTTLANGCFSGYKAITSVVIPDNVTTINGQVFGGCTNLTKINVGSGVTSIGSKAFYYCTGLTALIFNSATPPTLANTDALSGTNNCPIYVPAESVEAYKAANNWSTYASRIFAIEDAILFTPTNGDPAISVKNYELATANYVQSTDVPSTIKNGAGSLEISEGVTRIGTFAFQSGSSLTSVTIPSTVTRIEDAAFDGCSSLTSVTVNATTPPTLYASVFSNTNNCPIYVPAASVDAYKAASGWSTYASRIQAIPEDVKPAFKFTSSVDSSKDITVNCEDTETAGTLKANDLGMSSQQIDEFRSAENTGSVEIGDCVKIYMAAACYTAKGISEVKLNEGLERIGDFAFGGMSALTEITIPSTVTNISYQAFYADRALQGITCLATTPPTLGSEVFGDTNNCTIYVPYDSVDAYKSAWSQYADRIQAIPAE